MPTMEIVPISTAVAEFEERRQFDFFDRFLDEPAGDILVYRGDYNCQGNLHVADLNPENLANVAGIIIDGNFTVTGTLSNYIDRVKDRRDFGLELLVTGAMTVGNLISTNATVAVHRDLTAETIYLFYDNGTSALKVEGVLQAKALIVNDEHRCEFDESQLAYDLDLYECEYEQVCEIFVDRVIGGEDDKLDHALLIRMLESGENIFR
jgi:hypothetical protein